ncbi:piggyBac transposable element-derived protein 4-like [Ischnura elegans]|uniref:piggyBac transposable element-derived protein 4-like n=1 Tax=Ischnura elegans TaxID=197161 RepID=UPI001ED8BF8D|nr:piggyBac transposable element-derived protein 4-like [Ischnura elegans]
MHRKKYISHSEDTTTTVLNSGAGNRRKRKLEEDENGKKTEAETGPSVSGCSKNDPSRALTQRLTEDDLRRLLSETDSSGEDEDLWEESAEDFHPEISDSEDESEDEDLGDSELDRTNISATDTIIETMAPNPSGTDRFCEMWKNEQPAITRMPFAGCPGLKESPAGNHPRNYFDLIANEAFYDLLVSETNRQAETLQSANVSPHSRIADWKHMSRDEFQKFLGLLFHMGTIRLNRIQDYWKKDDLFNLTCFSRYMPRDRFLGILQTLHFAANPTENEPLPEDKLFKIRPLINHFQGRMHAIYSPAKDLSLDESMVLWRGRLIFRQYMKGKRHKYGIKIYLLTESSGIVIRMLVYTGSADKEVGGQGHVRNVVHKLLQGREGFGHSVYLDNYYNSVQLSRELLGKEIYCTGTLRVNRAGNPKEIVSQKIKKGEIVKQWSHDGICVLKWRDKRDVLVITSEYGSQLLEVPNRKGILKLKPEAIVMYNKFMRGIDHGDQMLAYYPCEHKSVKWYKKLGIHIFQLIIINSYLLYQKYSGHKKTLYEFRIELIRSLVGAQTGPTSRPSTPKPPESHFPDFFPADGGNRRKQKRCRVCHTKGVRKTVTTFCPDCPDEPGLCLRPCFIEYHGKMPEKY